MSSITSRLSRAWLALTGRQEKRLATMLETWRDNVPTYNPVNFAALAEHGWRRNELIYACIQKTANTAAQVQTQVVGADGEPLENHPLARLLEHPNPFMNEFDFLTAVIVYQYLAGVAYFEKVPSRLGQTVELWPLRPDWVQIIPSSRDFIGGYLYTVPGRPPVALAAEQVLRFPLADPLDQYHGWPPVAVAARVGDVDSGVTDYLKLLIEKGGTPPGLLKTTQKLNDAQVADIRRRWGERYGGVEGWLAPAVLDSDAEYQRTGATLNEMGFDVLDARNEARICMVLRVPPILMGAKIGLDRSTFSNYAEARRAWWQDDLLPLYANLTDVLNGLAAEWGDVQVEFDYGGVYALAELLADQRAAATEAWNAGGMTLNEYRAALDLPELPGPEGQAFKAPAPSLLPAGAAAGKAQPGPAERKSDPPPDADERRRHERIIERAMRAYLTAQQERILAEVNT